MKRLLLTATLILFSLGHANAAKLESIGWGTFKSSAIGCDDIQDTLNPAKSRQLADRAEEFFGMDLPIPIFKEMTKCQYFDRDRDWGFWRVIGQSLPQLPSDKVAICVTGMFLVNEPTGCKWVVTDKTNVIWKK